jgi:hypothetical protein
MDKDDHQDSGQEAINLPGFRGMERAVEAAGSDMVQGPRGQEASGNSGPRADLGLTLSWGDDQAHRKTLCRTPGLLGEVGRVGQLRNVDLRRCRPGRASFKLVGSGG